MPSQTLPSSIPPETSTRSLFYRLVEGVARWRSNRLAAVRCLPADLSLDRSLLDVEPGDPVYITAVRLEHDRIEWLRAIGIEEGEWITVLRRALFGGPIHLRCSSGGEFALDTALARVILIRSHVDVDSM